MPKPSDSRSALRSLRDIYMARPGSNSVATGQSSQFGGQSCGPDAEFLGIAHESQDTAGSEG